MVVEYESITFEIGRLTSGEHPYTFYLRVKCLVKCVSVVFLVLAGSYGKIEDCFHNIFSHIYVKLFVSEWC